MITLNPRHAFHAARKLLPLALPMVWFAFGAMGASLVHELKATARDGQVFLTWQENETADGTSFNIYVAGKPITDVSMATRIGHHIERHSARDWWEDPASFKKHVPSGKPIGYRIGPGLDRLDPRGGLFVHTLRKDSPAQLFFAVTHSDAGGKEDATLTLGANSLAAGVTAAPGAIQPIWQADGPLANPEAGKGKPLWLNLHAKGGVVAGMEYLVFGDETMGWREGLPFKFSVRIEHDEIVVRPTDRVWINRPHKEASDGGTPAIWTFWYGYNSKIYDRALMGEGVPTNYTERRNLWILDWVRRRYQPDTNRWYCSGGSMGGCGTISFALRHPELFAACHALVPIVSYTYLGKASASRLEPSCWTGAIPASLKTSDGVELLDRMDGAKFVMTSPHDLPFVFLINGRQDGSIPWENNPRFYRALTDAHQGFAAYWDNGAHSTSGRNAPADVLAWQQRFHRFRLDESYPAFSNTSSDRNPGTGAPDNGDIVGWIGRGMDWKDIEDTADHFAITVLADYPSLEYPVRTDMTLRRVQRFKTVPGEQLNVSIGNAVPVRITADSNGRITIPGVVIPNRAGVRISLQR